jgi:phosphate starvation-inducible protein PhoH
VVFSHEDVIRHDLVGKIVAAYDRAAGKLASAKADKTEKKADGKADVRE